MAGGGKQPYSVIEAWLESRGTLAFTAQVEKEEERTKKMEKEQLERVENRNWRCPENRGHRVSGRREFNLIRLCRGGE